MKKLFYTVFICLLSSFIYGQLPEMVTIPNGSFSMGCNDEWANKTPVHMVTISSFKMGKFEITVAEFAAFVNSTGYRTDAEKKGKSFSFINGIVSPIVGVMWKDDEEGQRRNDSDWNKPVIYVSWNDAIAYCQWLSHKTGKKYRLPTEAEWEYAAGNGTKHTTYSWGNFLPGSNDAVGNVADETIDPKYGSLNGERFKGYTDGYYFAAPVGSYSPNNFGLYDMTGNVWEWCNDWYDANYYSNSPSINPLGPAYGQSHVTRGGSWDCGLYCHIDYRCYYPSDYSELRFGFRVACSL